ncbi:hypothetical protein AB0I81_14855 [Nonomuraea sp. NPDC050404]
MGDHKGEPTDRPFDKEEDGKKQGSTHDQAPESPGGAHGKDGDEK